MFQWLATGLLAWATIASISCQPLERGDESVEGAYLVAGNKLFYSDEVFDLRLPAVYPTPKREGLQDPSVQVSDRDLTLNRCTWCHGCGFKAAFDWEHYGAANWNPRYRGQQWQPVLERMMQLENSFLQEEMIIRRIFKFLNDETTGQYDESVDPKGAIEIPIDELPSADTASPDTESHDGHSHEGAEEDHAPAEPGDQKVVQTASHQTQRRKQAG